MKKIFNWTIGSAFRTIGRFIGLLLISLLFGLLIVKSDIKITDIFNIGRVYADTAQTFSTSQARIYTDNAGTITSTSWYDNPHTFSPTYPVTSMQLRLRSSNGFKSDNSYKFKFSFLPTPDAINASGVTFNDGTNTFTSVNCSGWGREDNGYYANICYVQPVTNISSSGYMYVNINFNAGYLNSIRSWVGTFEEYTGTGAIITEQAGNIIDSSNDNTQDIINNNNQNTQDIINNQNQNAQQQNINDIDNKRNSFDTINNDCGDLYKYNMKKGKRFNNNGTLIDVEQYYYTEDYILLNTTDKIVLSGFGEDGTGTLIVYDSNKNYLDYWTVRDRIVNLTTLTNPYYFRISTNMPTGMVFKNKGCKSKIDTLSDTLTDDNISNNDVQNSLNFSTTENAYGPFATFLTLPLQWVQDILASNQSCRPLSLPLPFVNQNLVIPCMTDFWNSTGALGTLIQLCWIAVVGVRIFNGLFKLVVDTTSSEDNAEELTKIRSWEL